MPDTPPEGFDTDAAKDQVREAAEGIASSAADFREKATARAGEYAAQATDKARDYVEQGKSRATGALDEVARLIKENAGQIDGVVGSHYGDYARRAADAVAGFSGTLRDKDAEELIDDARDLVRRSPTIALSAAAAAGFMIARVIKAGSDAIDAAAVKAAPVATAPIDEDNDNEDDKAARKAAKSKPPKPPRE